MDVGRLLRRRQALRIGHRREVAVIGVADPARARQIGAIFAGAAAAQHRLAGGRDDVGIEAVAVRREALRGRIPDRSRRARRSRGWQSRPDGASTKVMRSARGLRHRMPPWHSASAFNCGRNSFSTKLDTAASRCGCGVEGGMNVEAGAAAGAGRAAIGQRRIGVGGVDHPRQVADQRLQRLAQLGKSLRQVARHRARVRRPPMPSRRCAETARARSACPRSRRRRGRRNRCRWRRSTAAPGRACDRAGGVSRR